ncbi:MAG: VanZ family protein [Anaerolineales bacterium]
MLIVQRFALRWGPALLMMATIFVFSGTPGDDLPGLGWWEDVFTNGGHAVGYALLAAALLYGLSERRVITIRMLWLAVLLATVYGVTDELHQGFVPGRSPDWMDVFVDGAGALIGAGVYRWLERKRRLRRALQRSE